MEFNQEQQMLADMATKYLQEQYTFEQRQMSVRDHQGFNAEQWQQFAEMGWLAAPLPEAAGGFDAGAMGLVALCEPMGAHLVTEPFLESAVICSRILAESGNALAMDKLTALGAGELTAALAIGELFRLRSWSNTYTWGRPHGDRFTLYGDKTVVLNGTQADVLLVTAKTWGATHALFLVDANLPGIKRKTYTTWDGRNAANIRFDNVDLGPEALLAQGKEAERILQMAFQFGVIAAGAESVGMMQALLDATVDYTKQRVQYGSRLADFQVLRHKMVDMLVQLEQSRSLLLAAASAFDAADHGTGRLVAALKVKTAAAGRFVAQNAVQLHGGIATTDDLNVGHYLKRLTALEGWPMSRDAFIGEFIRETARVG